MPTVSISKAIKLSGKSRQHFYDEYIKTGKISVDRTDPKRPLIDTSEILRVFGKLHSDSPAEDTVKKQEDSLEVETIRLELERMKSSVDGLHRLIDEKDTRIAEKDLELARQRERISGLEIRYDKLLESRESRRDGLFSNFLRKIGLNPSR